MMGSGGEAAAEVYSTGSLVATSDPAYACGHLNDISPDAGPDQECKDYRVENCPGPDEMVTLRVTLNAGLDGTIIFFSSGNGRGWWAVDKLSGFPRASHLLQRDLSTGDNDFKIVEVKWRDAWNHGNDTTLIGPAKLACRVATVVTALLANETYHHCDNFPSVCTKVCATGQSGGANQLAYTLTHYDMGDRYDGVVFTSGPPYADLELGCSSCGGTPVAADGCFSSRGRWGVDTSYDTPNDPRWDDLCPGAYADPEECGDTEFPDSLCIHHQHEGTPPGNQEFADSLPDTSVAVETTKWNYEYPVSLGISFIFGLLDDGAARPQGKIYKDVVDVENDVDFAELAFVGHKVHEDTLGTAEILLRLADYCGAIP